MLNTKTVVKTNLACMWVMQHDWSCLSVSVLACFMQNSVFGRCEVLYEVTRVPRSVALARPEWFPSAERCGHLNFFELIKTRNFTNCEYSAEFHFGLPVSKKCHPGGIACDDFWTVSTRQSFWICGLWDFAFAAMNILACLPNRLTQQ